MWLVEPARPHVGNSLSLLLALATLLPSLQYMCPCRVQVAARGIATWNPAFDVAPAPLIAGIATERGMIPKDDNGLFKVRCSYVGWLDLRLFGICVPASACKCMGEDGRLKVRFEC